MRVVLSAIVLLAILSTAYTASALEITPVADSFTDQRIPYRNYGTANTLIAYNSAGSFDHYIYIKFVIPEGVTINSATLRLHYMFANAYGGERNYSVFNCSDDSWHENTICWENQPALGYKIDSVTAAMWGGGRELIFDVTKDVKTQVENGDRVITFVIKSSEKAYTDYLFAYSRESALPPVLEIS